MSEDDSIKRSQYLILWDEMNDIGGRGNESDDIQSFSDNYSAGVFETGKHDYAEENNNIDG